MKVELHRDIARLKREARYWAGLVRQVNFVTGRDNWAAQRLIVGRERYVSAGLAVEQLLMSVGRLLERIDILEWNVNAEPEHIANLREKYSRELLQRAFPHADFLPKEEIESEFYLRDEIVATYVQQARNRSLFIEEPEDYEIHVTAPGDEFEDPDRFEASVNFGYSIRAFGAWARVVPALRLVQAISDTPGAFFRERLALAAEPPLAPLKTYVSSELLFPWMRSRARAEYSPIFNTCGFGEQRLLGPNRDFIERITGMSNLREQMEVLRPLISRFADGIEILGYESWIKAMLDGYHQGRNSLSGVDLPMNVIPSTVSVEGCCEVVLGIARGGLGTAKIRARPVAGKVNEHLERCADYTQLLVFVTDSWFPELAEILAQQISLLRNRGGNAIVLLVTEDRLTPIPLSG